jgi:hypothetical protein
MPAAYTYVAGDNGVHSFFVTAHTAATTLEQTGGKEYAAGPPKEGVELPGAPYTFLAGDNGAHDFSITAYTAETIKKFTVTGGGKAGDSEQVVVNAAP